MTQLQVQPGRSIGPVRLGMSRSDTLAIPGAVEFGKGPRPDHARSVSLQSLHLHAHFSDETDQVIEVEAGGDADALLGNIALLRRPLQAVLSDLRSYGLDVTEDPDGADAPSVGLGIYAPAGVAEGVIVYAAEQAGSA